MIEWAKRESEREEEQRLARLNQQEQEDLELAIALSKSEISEAWRILLSFVNHTIFFLNTEALYSVLSKLPMSMGIQKVWDSCKCDKSLFLVFLFVSYSISDLSSCPPPNPGPYKSSNPVRQLHLGSCSDVHLLWAFACLCYFYL